MSLTEEKSIALKAKMASFTVMLLRHRLSSMTLNTSLFVDRFCVVKTFEGCFLSVVVYSVTVTGLQYVSHGFTSREQNHGFSHISNETPCGKAALVVDVSDADFCRRLDTGTWLSNHPHNTANHTTRHHMLDCQTNFPAFIAASDLAWTHFVGYFRRSVTISCQVRRCFCSFAPFDCTCSGSLWITGHADLTVWELTL